MMIACASGSLSPIAGAECARASRPQVLIEAEVIGTRPACCQHIRYAQE